MKDIIEQIENESIKEGRFKIFSFTVCFLESFFGVLMNLHVFMDSNYSSYQFSYLSDFLQIIFIIGIFIYPIIILINVILLIISYKRKFQMTFKALRICLIINGVFIILLIPCMIVLAMFWGVKM